MIENKKSNILISRSDYKKIKFMNREELDDYLKRVWRRGYEAGLKKITEAKEPLPEDNSNNAPVDKE